MRGTRDHKKNGQAMLIVVLSIGGLLLGATTIAGFLLTYQLQTTADVQNSAKAIFAADTGIEWTLYSYFIGATSTPTLSNGATMVSTCYDSKGKPVACASPGVAQTAVAQGTSQNSQRAFFVDLSASTSSFP